MPAFLNTRLCQHKRKFKSLCEIMKTFCRQFIKSTVGLILVTTGSIICATKSCLRKEKKWREWCYLQIWSRVVCPAHFCLHLKCFNKNLWVISTTSQPVSKASQNFWQTYHNSCKTLQCSTTQLLKFPSKICSKFNNNCFSRVASHRIRSHSRLYIFSYRLCWSNFFRSSILTLQPDWVTHRVLCLCHPCLGCLSSSKIYSECQSDKARLLRWWARCHRMQWVQRMGLLCSIKALKLLCIHYYSSLSRCQ